MMMMELRNDADDDDYYAAHDDDNEGGDGDDCRGQATIIQKQEKLQFSRMQSPIAARRDQKQQCWGYCRRHVTKREMRGRH